MVAAVRRGHGDPKQGSKVPRRGFIGWALGLGNWASELQWASLSNFRHRQQRNAHLCIGNNVCAVQAHSLP